MKSLLLYERPLRTGLFKKRYKRFFVDIEVENGQIETVHCANSGSMVSCLVENAKAYTFDSMNDARKLRHTLELLEFEDGFACLNTARANQLMEKLFQAFLSTQGLQTLAKSDAFEGQELMQADFRGLTGVRREAKFSEGTRFDFLLENNEAKRKIWAEVKTVSMRCANGEVAFPDAKTERGQKHLRELVVAKKQGDEAFLFFVIMRGAAISPEFLGKGFRPASEIDPIYSDLLQDALAQNVEVRVVVPEITLEGFGVRGYYRYT